MVHVRRDFPTRFLKLGKKSILKLVSHIAVEKFDAKKKMNWDFSDRCKKIKGFILAPLFKWCYTAPFLAVHGSLSLWYSGIRNRLHTFF